MNAKTELLEHAADRAIQYVEVKHHLSYDETETIAGTVADVLPRLNFEYYNGYGSQNLEGTIWYTDGTWSERVEYDGSEWWEYRECPPLPTNPMTDTP